jgi:4-carboxymuconolactone decarboxylase
MTSLPSLRPSTKSRMRPLIGEQQVLDLAAVSGTYVTLAMLLAMAEQSVPPDKEEPFKPGEP